MLGLECGCGFVSTVSVIIMIANAMQVTTLSTVFTGPYFFMVFVCLLISIITEPGVPCCDLNHRGTGLRYLVLLCNTRLGVKLRTGTLSSRSSGLCRGSVRNPLKLGHSGSLNLSVLCDSLEEGCPHFRLVAVSSGKLLLAFQYLRAVSL